MSTAKRYELSEVIEINLSKEEDAVTTLAVAQSAELWATAFAGINSSRADQEAGKNEHLRSFRLEYPPRRKKDAAEVEKETAKLPATTGSTRPLGRAALFTPSIAKVKETYQRVLRLSKAKDNGPRMGVVATGLAPEGEVVAFKADTSNPGAKDVCARFNVGEKVEAADVDVFALESSGKEAKGNEFRIVYCTDYDVYLADVNYHANEKAQLEPHCIFGTGHPDTFASSSARPKFRCVRFLTPTLLLVLSNLPKGGGSELLLLEISGIVILRKRLHKKIKSATGLAISTLPHPPTHDLIQHAIAVSGADLSITVLTLDHPPSSPYGKLSFRTHVFLPEVHSLPITSIALSTHEPPSTTWTKTPPQYLKLASTSISNHAIVHTFPLTAYPTPPPDDMPMHYLLSPPTSRRKALSENFYSIIVAIVAIAIGAFLLQAFTEIRGGVPEKLGAKDWLPASIRDRVAQPYMFAPEDGGVKGAWSRSIQSEVRTAESYISVVTDAAASASASVVEGSSNRGGRLRDLLAQRNTGSDTTDAGADPSAHDIVIHHDDDNDAGAAVSVGTRPASSSAGDVAAKTWEQLTPHEREGWKQKLLEAGEWTLEEGETVLKGVLFSGLAGAVGAAVG